MKLSVKKFLVFSFVCLFIFAAPVCALDFKGLAHMDYRRGKRHYQADLVVILKKDGSHYFETLDDFGNQLMVFKGDLTKKWLKKMGFDLEVATFLNLLKYEPFKLDAVVVKNNCHQVIEVSSKKRAKKWSMTYQDFNKGGFPKQMNLNSSKAQLTFQWTDLTSI